MGDAQSAQREDKQDAAAEEDSGKVEDAQTEEETQDRPVKNNGQISELSGKADGSIADVNGHCEDEIAAEAILSRDKDVSETENLPTEVENVELNETEIPEANEEEPLEIIDMEVKQNDINESFRRFFSNIGLKLTVKRGSGDKGEIATDVSDETNKEEPNRPEDVEETATETKSEDVEQNTDVNKVQETYDNDSTTCPTLTDGTSEDVLENAEEKTTETKEEAVDNIPETGMTLPVVDDAKPLVDAALEEEPQPTSPSNPDEEVVSPIKKFFTTGIFSSLRKKKKLEEDETTDKELVDMGKKESAETTEQTVQDQQEQIEEITPGVEARELKDEIQPAESAQTTDSSEVKSPSTDQSNIIVSEPEIMTSQEKDKVQASPLKRLLSGSSFTRRSKKQKGRRSSDTKLSDSGEHIADQLMSSTESAEHPVKVRESPPAPPPSAEVGGEEEGAWASFKKLMTPKKRMKRPSLGNEETQIPAAVDEPKPTEREQISDHSTEESKKRKDSSVSWEAVLCGSGRRRSRKTSDSEDEMPQGENDKTKLDGVTHGAEPQVESSNEVDDIIASSPKQAGSPSESDGGSTWKSFKKLVTPKRKVKDEEESKENAQSDSEVTQDEPSFSIKNLLPGRKKRKSAEKPDQVSSDEADKETASGDEDSETPAVVPLSEFDTPETEVHIQTQADIESHVSKVSDNMLQQDQFDQMTEHVQEQLQISTKEVQDGNDVLENQASTIPAISEEPDELTELISKHQQLSDIPEEGIITDTMATPASVTEEAARDDTIADDLIEITSEAITAPEPVDITQADETEMISAVSQLSESSKTSGNTTPVPAEYDMKETEVLLQQVVETISATPDASPVFSEDLHSERIAGSVSHQVLETFVKEEQTILEIHRQADATAIRTGLKVSKLDETDEFAASSQTESISELNDAASTEVASEVSTEEFDTAQISVDEVHEVSVSQAQETVKELDQVENNDDNQCPAQSLSEVNKAVSTEILLKGEDIVPDEVSLRGAHQEEAQFSKIESHEEDLSATADETAARAEEQEVKSLLETKDEIIQPGSTGDLIEAKEQLVKADVDPENQEEIQADAAKIEHIQESETPESELSTTPWEDSVQSSEKEHTEVSVEEENKEPTVVAVKIDQIAEELAVQAPALEEDTVQSLEKEVAEDDLAPEPVTDEPKQEAEDLTEEKLQQEIEQPVDTVKIDHDRVAEVVLHSEVGTVQALERQVISEDHPEAVTDKFKQETVLGLENKDGQPMDASKPEHVQEPEVLKVAQAATLDSGVILEDTQAADVDIDDVVTETETEVDASMSTQIQQSTEVVVQLDQALEVNEDQKTGKTTDDIPLGVQVEHEDHSPEVVDEIQAVTALHISSVNEDASIVQVLEKTLITEKTPAPCVDKTVVVDESEHEVHLSEVQVSVEEKEGQHPHIETRTAEIEHAVVPEVIACNLKDVIAAIPDLVIEKSSIESETVDISEETSVVCVDNVVVVDEPKHEVHHSEVQISIEGEKELELSGTETRTAAVEHAVLAQVIRCNFKDVTSVIPDVFIEKTSEVHEPVIGTVTSEQELRGTVETPTVLIKENVTETAQEGRTVMMMHSPSVEFEDNHSIQVQIVNVDITSAETSVDSVEVGVTESKEVVEVCHKTIQKVDNLSATLEIGEEIINEEGKVMVQEVLQRVKEKLPEPKSVVEVEQELANDSTQQSDTVESKLSEEEDQKVEEATTGPNVASDHSAIAAKQEIKHDTTSDIPGALDVNKHDYKEDSDKTKAELEKTSEGVTAAQLAVKKMDEELKEAQVPPTAQTQIATPGNTALAVPQNTGIISSIGNVESPSSLSLEFKLNIQFGQSKAPTSPTSPPPPTERTETVKQTEMSEIGIQAVEEIQPVKQINEAQGGEIQKKTSLTEAAVQATETTEPAMTQESTDTAVIKDHPVLMDVGIKSVETVEPIEEITSIERVTPSAQATETIQPVQQTQRRLLLSQPVISEVSVLQTKVAEQTEEDCEQDVWMDAEENISAQNETKVLPLEMEKSLERQIDNDQEQKAEAHTDESHQEMHTTGETCEIESEGEDFAVAPEDPETATTNTSTTEWD